MDSGQPSMKVGVEAINILYILYRTGVLFCTFLYYVAVKSQIEVHLRVCHVLQRLCPTPVDCRL